VLPFVNMSGDKEQEYFSDGLTEELLNSLSRINELQVAARTSAFSFKGKDTDIGTIARKLNVGAVLEGSVRRSGHTVRITTQLINAITGFHLWSETYDRGLGDVLRLQTEIAEAVASALKVRLLGDVATSIEVGGTRTPTAFDAYLRASKSYFIAQSGKDSQAAIAGYGEAIRLDPNYALAYAARSLALVTFANEFATATPVIHASIDKAHADAAKAIALAPNLAEGHLALARIHASHLEYISSSEEYEQAHTLAPGNARVLWNYGNFVVLMGRNDSGLAALRRAVSLDPLNPEAHSQLGEGLTNLRRYSEAIKSFKDAEALELARPDANSAEIGLDYYLLGDLDSARSACEKSATEVDGRFCLAMTYDKLGRHADAEGMLARYRASNGDRGAVTYSIIYAQWGDNAGALAWLETAVRLRDPSLLQLKAPFFDPLRNESRFRAIERALKFPD
ncbi:MAG: hypothetical protein ACRD3E_02845, partial [Terriglobales bacterium]